MLKRRPITVSCLVALAAAACLDIAACAAPPGGETDWLEEEDDTGETEDGLDLVPLDDPCITIQRGSSAGQVYDTYVDPALPTTNFGTNALIRAGGGKRGLLQFSIASGAIPPGATIKSAEVVLTPVENPGTGTLDVHKLNGMFIETSSQWFAGTTYNTQPPFNATPLRSVPYSGLHTVRFDLTQQVTSWIQNGQNYGIMIEGEGNFNVASSENGSHTKPYLRVCYSPSPCQGVADGTACNQPAQCRVNGVCQGGLCVNGSPASAGTVCRSSGGACDPAEVCNGTTTGCPAQAMAPTSTVCRASAGACDAEETCDGAGRACPADQLEAAGTVCRGASGACDVAEVCSGSAVDCPSDGVKTNGTLCRDASGPCDVAEHCNGTAKTCPSDGVSPSGTVCRSESGACDVAEACNGSTKTCPSDGVLPAGTVCRADAGVCDVGEVCNGSSASCPSDGFEPNGTTCGSSSVCSGGSCVSCGGILAPCCNGTCNGTEQQPLVCNAYNNTCQPCGAAGQSCCNGTYGCTGNLSCVSGTCMQD